MSETSSGKGLTVTYDEETLSFTFDWDPVTHPQYNFLEGMTSNELVKMITSYLEFHENDEKESSQARFQGGGSGSGTTEGINDPEPQS